MEIDFRKYNLSEVNVSARDYIQTLKDVDWYYSTPAIKQLGSKEHPIPENVTNAVTRLHNAIAAIDRDAVVKVLGNYKDFEEEDPRGWVKSAKSALEDLWPLITRKRLHIAKRIDPNLKQLRQDCEGMIVWLDQQLAILNDRDYMTPTLKDEAWIEELPDMEVVDWLALYIFIPELSLSGRKRLLDIALVTDGIDEQKKAKLRAARMQIEEQLKETTRIEQATNELRSKLAGVGLGKDIIDGFLLNYPQMLPRQFKKWYNDHLKNNDVTLKDFWSLCIRIAHSDKDSNPGRGWTYRNIADIT